MSLNAMATPVALEPGPLIAPYRAGRRRRWIVSGERLPEVGEELADTERDGLVAFDLTCPPLTPGLVSEGELGGRPTPRALRPRSVNRSSRLAWCMSGTVSTLSSVHHARRAFNQAAARVAFIGP